MPKCTICRHKSGNLQCSSGDLGLLIWWVWSLTESDMGQEGIRGWPPQLRVWLRAAEGQRSWFTPYKTPCDCQWPGHGPWPWQEQSQWNTRSNTLAVQQDCSAGALWCRRLREVEGQVGRGRLEAVDFENNARGSFSMKNYVCMTNNIKRQKPCDISIPGHLCSKEHLPTLKVWNY